ncbi:MAG: adenylate/guanylate cyclase domain-containing protein [Syntrophus sp. (in: bacteria)]
MPEQEKTGLVSSIAVLSKTGLSRATLNNYIKMGFIPPPLVKKPDDPSIKAKQIGYFLDSVWGTIDRIRLYKKEGRSMKEIGSLLSLKTNMSSGENFSEIMKNDVETFSEKRCAVNVPGGKLEKEPYSEGIKQRESQDMPIPETNDIQLTIDELQYPSYLLNNKFEIEWINPVGEKIIFGRSIRSIKIAEGRNIFRLLIDMGSSFDSDRTMLDFHMSMFAQRFQKKEINKLYPAITKNEICMLEDLYDRTDNQSSPAAFNAYINLSGDPGTIYQGHKIQFREGMLCVYAPADKMMQGVLELLSRRGRLINDLLKQRLPTQIFFAVMVADLQDSVRICAELPPEEYFSLINQIWKCMEGSFKKYYGTYGKHTGDGMVYYFLRDSDSNYIMNAILCAMELRENMKKLSNEWKINKGWFNDLFLNIGINEGEEYFGMIPAAPSIEFTALGDSVNYAGRLSDLARYGSIWTTKNLISRLSEEERKLMRYGIRRKQQDREVLIESVFSRVMDLVPPDGPRSSKFMDIATLPVTEVLNLRQ